MNVIITVPLHALRLSNLNIRRTGGKDIAALAASIKAEGLLQNLTAARIPPNMAEECDHYDVIAGGRRLRALWHLRDAGHLPADHPVPVNVVSAAIATEIGIAENTIRERMHPHDEFVAFRDLAAKGESNEAIGAKFGVTPLVVERRLRLANVAPEILHAFREDRLTLDQMMAFALTDDWDAQMRIFTSIQNLASLRPDRIRHLIAEREIPTNDKRVRFVGLQTYLDAGGALRRDLFDEAGGGYCLDENLLDQLSTEKLMQAAADVRSEGWSFAEIVGEAPWEFRGKHNTIDPPPRDATDEETAELDRLKARLRWLEDNTDFDEDDAACEEAESANDRINELEESLVGEYTPAQKAIAGAMLYINHDGALRIERGLLPKGAPKPSGAPKANDPAQGTTPAPAALSDALHRRLTAHRTIALQSGLMANANVALAALTHALLADLHRHQQRGTSALQVRATNIIDSPAELAFEDVANSEHRKRVIAALDDLSTTLRVPKRAAELLPWCLHQNRDTLCAVLAAVSVMTVNATTHLAGQHESDWLAAALDLDMADYWQPTAKTLFSITPKAIGMEAVREVHGDAAAERLVPLKKDAFAGECERLLARTGWLPKPLRRPGYKTPTPNADRQPDTAQPKLKPVTSKPAPKAASKPPAKKSPAKKPAAKKPAAKKPAAAKKRKAA